MTLTLYDLGAAYLQLRALAEEGADADAWQQSLDDLQEEAIPKLLKLGRLIREQQAAQVAIKSEIDRLKLRLDLALAAEERMKAYVKLSLETLALDRVSDAGMTIALQASPPAVRIQDETAIDNRWRLASLTLPASELPVWLFQRATFAYDKRAMLAAHAEGREIPGVAFASGTHVRIR